MLEKSTFSLKDNAQKLRKNMTPQELKLWCDFLHKLPLTVNRQKQLGEYIVDFYCASAKLVIEIDGAGHFTRDGKNEDKKRDLYLKSVGLNIMRFSNSEVDKDFEKVCRTIWNFIEVNRG